MEKLNIRRRRVALGPVDLGRSLIGATSTQLTLLNPDANTWSFVVPSWVEIQLSDPEDDIARPTEESFIRYSDVILYHKSTMYLQIAQFGAATYHYRILIVKRRFYALTAQVFTPAEILQHPLVFSASFQVRTRVLDWYMGHYTHIEDRDEGERFSVIKDIRFILNTNPPLANEHILAINIPQHTVIYGDNPNETYDGVTGNPDGSVAKDVLQLYILTDYDDTPQGNFLEISHSHYRTWYKEYFSFLCLIMGEVIVEVVIDEEVVIAGEEEAEVDMVAVGSLITYGSEDRDTNFHFLDECLRSL